MRGGGVQNSGVFVGASESKKKEQGVREFPRESLEGVGEGGK